MTESKCPFANLSRRGFFKAAGGLGLFAAGAGIGAGIGAPIAEKVFGGHNNATEHFYGNHQPGIITAQQTHTYFAAFDLVAKSRDDIIKMLKSWTEAAAKMSEGQIGGDAAGLAPARLTLTFGFGPGLFDNRYGLAARRPAALVDLPKFNGDQLIPEKTGGDISVQACADDPQVAFHAIRQLVKLAYGIAQIRWGQTGFLSYGNNKNETPRNLQGFKDGTQNPKTNDMDKFVWVGNEGPAWMQGGSYLVVRRIRIALEHWDKTDVKFQEQVLGRYKDSGAPLGKKNEFDRPDLNATDKDGNFIVPENSHLRLAASEANGGAQILRRGYSYNDGINFVAERWPPWRQGMEYDAGLLFVSYQRNPSAGFIKIFENMAKMDALNQFVTHNGSGLFACPGGVDKGEFIGQRLFAA